MIIDSSTNSTPTHIRDYHGIIFRQLVSFPAVCVICAVAFQIFLQRQSQSLGFMHLSFQYSTGIIFLFIGFIMDLSTCFTGTTSFLVYPSILCVIFMAFWAMSLNCIQFVTGWVTSIWIKCYSRITNIFSRTNPTYFISSFINSPRPFYVWMSIKALSLLNFRFFRCADLWFKNSRNRNTQFNLSTTFFHTIIKTNPTFSSSMFISFKIMPKFAQILSRVYCGWRYSSQYILTFRNNLKMVRINTVTDSANVIQFFTIWYSAMKQFIRKSMGTLLFRFSVNLCTNPSISSTLIGIRVQPTSISFCHSFPKSFFWGLLEASIRNSHIMCIQVISLFDKKDRRSICS